MTNYSGGYEFAEVVHLDLAFFLLNVAGASGVGIDRLTPVDRGVLSILESVGFTQDRSLCDAAAIRPWIKYDANNYRLVNWVA